MSTMELSEIKASYIADARGVACPGPLLEAKKAIGQVKVGEIVEIWSGDERTRKDLPRWAAKVGHEYLGYLPAEGYERLFLLRKK
jgi:TusA-related sulfurtransferase